MLKNATKSVHQPFYPLLLAPDELTTIRAALRIAHQLQQEPTEEMLAIGKSAKNPFFVAGANLPTDHFPEKAIFKAMVAAMPEVEL